MKILGFDGVRRVAVGAVFGVGLSGAAHGYQEKPQNDPANLAGEQVKARVTADDLPQNVGAVALAQTLKKLGTRASLMLIVAHPDDEDGGMLTYESRGQGVRVGTMTLNRGEGGQNLMSADFEDALGLVRTQELLAADRYMGVDQMFGTVIDFGFSKTKEEAFAKWGHERVLYDCVRAVRLYRPLVLASVFVGGVTDGHGQHQVSGQMAQEVFDAAGDPKVFPDQIAQGLQPWTPLKVYARMPFARVSKDGMFDYATGKYSPARFYNYVTKTWSNEEPKANVTVPEGEYSKLLGMSYVQFARKGLALQKTQIGGGVRLAPEGKFDVGYTRYGSRVGPAGTRNGGAAQESGFFDGVDVSLVGIAALAPDAAFLQDGLNRLQGIVTKAESGFSLEAPEKSAPVLAEGLKSVDVLIAQVEASGIGAREKTDVLHELRVKQAQFNEALVEALDVKLTATVNTQSDSTVSEGQPLQFNVKIVNPVGAAVELIDAQVVSTSGKVVKAAHSAKNTRQELEREHADILSWTFPVPITRPYFGRPNIEQPFYDVTDANLRDAPGTPSPFVAEAHLCFGDVPFELKSVVENGQPVGVVPGVSVMVSPAAGIVQLGEKAVTVTARVRNDLEGAAAGSVRLDLPAGWKAEPERGAFSLEKQGDVAEVAFVVTPVGVGAGRDYRLSAVAEVGGKSYREGYRAVGYAGLTRTNFYRAATYRAVGADVKVAAGLKVAYLPGTGDEVAMTLAEMGVKPTTISVEDVAAGRLGGYDAVVLGVRAYAAHQELAAANGKLLEYAANGGTVIVQYNTGEMPAGPYPMSLGESEKVVEENAKVVLLEPKAKALSWPNRITEKDFDGWVEERGHGFMGTWDPRYEALTESHDVDQDPQKGGLLVAKTGKGYYVYEAYALYRQLPEGVPGAFRIFANLLSLGKSE